jgi:hypothetical protein
VINGQIRRTKTYIKAGGWMDGWMDGWMGGWMGGWMMDKIIVTSETENSTSVNFPK